MRKPDFEHNLLRALRGERPERATMFELFLYDELYERLAGHGWDGKTRLSYKKMVVDAMAAGGYDYAPFLLPDFYYPKQAREQASTHSLNGQGIITDRESFEKYIWPDISRCRPLPEWPRALHEVPCRRNNCDTSRCRLCRDHRRHDCRETVPNSVPLPQA